MSDLDQHQNPPPHDPAPPPEPWSIWWSRAVQVSGLGIMGWQTFGEQTDRQWLLLCAMGMMLGEAGLKSFLRFVRNAGGDQ